MLNSGGKQKLSCKVLKNRYRIAEESSETNDNFKLNLDT